MPAIEALDETVTARLAEGDTVLADGTFFRHDDLVALGLGERDSWAMGHAPLTGEGGTLEALAALDARSPLSTSTTPTRCCSRIRPSARKPRRPAS